MSHPVFPAILFVSSFEKSQKPDLKNRPEEAYGIRTWGHTHPPIFINYYSIDILRFTWFTY